MMSATVCNVLEVMLRTPGESINATVKIRRIIFTLQGDLNVRVLDRAINRGQRCSKLYDATDDGIPDNASEPLRASQ